MESAIKNLFESAVSKRKKKQNNEKEKLIEEINDLKLKLNAAQNRFEFVSSDSDIESTIYEIESINIRYRHLLRKAKEQNLSISPLDNW